jgi:hypothetical protein
MQFDNQFLATQTDGKPCHLTFSHLKDAMSVLVGWAGDNTV